MATEPPWRVKVAMAPVMAKRMKLRQAPVKDRSKDCRQ